MGKGKYSRVIMENWHTVGQMADASVRVRAWCRKCGTVIEVSPAAMAAYDGPHVSLLGLEAPCRVDGCDGKAFFMADGRGRLENLTGNQAVASRPPRSQKDPTKLGPGRRR